MKIEWVGKKLKACEKRLIKRSVKQTLLELEQDRRVSLCINIVGPEEIREINSRTRGIDKVTDVLSFPSLSISPFEKISVNVGRSELEAKGLFFIGDMALCMDEVDRQVGEYNESRDRVLARLVIHSVLHLLGFDHIEDRDFEVMEPVQNKILNSVVKK